MFFYRTLGVLLFTIMYGENPFQGRQEIILGDYRFPLRLESDKDPHGTKKNYMPINNFS